MTTPEALEDPTLLPLDEVRRRLGGISSTTLWRLMKHGEIVAITVGERRKMVPASAVARYVDSRAAANR